MTTDARDPQSAIDDGFHEIHLSGKQLVFLFMVTTVVSVFIFLCGVLVGRGVGGDSADPIGTGQAATETAAQAPPAPAGEAPDVPADSAAASEPTKLEPGTTMYTDLLRGPEPPSEKLTAAGGTATPARPPAAVPAATPSRTPAPPPAAKPAPAAAATASARPAGLKVQVAAVRKRAEADVIASRLKKRGYDAYVVEPDSATRMFRVRVGSYTDPAEAERVADRLRREEKLKPWIIR